MKWPDPDLIYATSSLSLLLDRLITYISRANQIRSRGRAQSYDAAYDISEADAHLTMVILNRAASPQSAICNLQAMGCLPCSVPGVTECRSDVETSMRS